VGTVGPSRATCSIFFLVYVPLTMVDREKVLAVLRRRFPGASDTDIAAAANAIVGLDEEWRDVESTDLGDLLERLRAGHEFRLLERHPSHR
jgi:hypothetical protein